MPSLIQEASTFAIDEQVYGDDLSRAGDDVQEEFSGPMLGNRTAIESHRALQTTRWRTLNYLYSIRGSGTVAGMHESKRARFLENTQACGAGIFSSMTIAGTVRT